MKHNNVHPFQKLYSFFEYIEEGLCKTAAAISAGLIIIMVAAVALSAILRHFANFNIPHIEELSGYALVVLVFLGLSYALKTGSHIKIDIVVGRLPKRTAQVMLIISCLVTLLVITVFLYYSVETIIDSIRFNERSLTLGAPQWIPRFFIFIGLIMFALSIIRLLVTEYRGFRGASKSKRQE